MRIRDTLLALTATVVAGSAVAAVATPAAAQVYYGPGYERPVVYGGGSYGYAPRPWYPHHYGWRPYGYGYGYGYGYYHPHHYWHYWR